MERNTADSPPGAVWPRLRRELLIVLFLVAFAIAVTWPLVTKISTEIVGGSGDSHLFYWNYWWFNHALFELKQDPFFCPIQLYPHGADLAFHTLCPLNCLVALPIQRLFGIPFAYNLIILLSLIAAAYTAYRLTFDLTSHRTASVAAGIMFGFSPYMMMRATGHMNLVGAWPLPLVVMFALRAFRTGRYRSAFLAGVFAGIQIWISMYYTLFAAITFVLIWLGEVLRNRRSLRNHVYCPALSALGALVASSPVLFFMLRSIWRSGAFLAPAQCASFGEGVDLLGFFIPCEISMVFGKVTYPIYARLYGRGMEGLAFVGIMCIICLVIALRRKWDPTTHLFVALALVFAVLALGDRLHVADHDSVSLLGRHLRIPLPAAALKFVPILNMIRVSSRFVILFQLALVCLAARGLSYFLDKFSGRRRTVATGLVFVCLFLDLSCSPYFSQPLRQDRLYLYVKELPGDFALMDVPFWAGSAVGWIGRPCWESISWSASQMTHQKAILSTLASRADADILRQMEASPLISAIIAAQDGKMTERTLELLTDDVVNRELQHYSLKLIVVHRGHLQTLSEGQLAYLFQKMGFKLLFRNDLVAVIETPLGPSFKPYVPKSLAGTADD